MTVDLPVLREPEQHLVQQSVRWIKLLRLACQGLNAKQASRLVDASYQTVRQVYADPAFRRAVTARVNQAFEGVDEAFEEREVSLHERLAGIANTSFNKLATLLEDEATSPALQVRIAQDFLDRHQPTQRGERREHTYTGQELARAARVGREIELDWQQAS